MRNDLCPIIVMESKVVLVVVGGGVFVCFCLFGGFFVCGFFLKGIPMRLQVLQHCSEGHCEKIKLCCLTDAALGVTLVPPQSVTVGSKAQVVTEVLLCIVDIFT